MKATLTRFDVAVTQRVQSLPAGLRPAMKIASFFGEPVVGGLLLIVAGVSAFLLHRPQEVQALVTAFVVLPIASIIKIFVKRTRPITYVPTTRLRSHSFPSGHSYGSMLGFGLLSWIAANVLGPVIAIPVIILAFIFVLLVGTSRIYLGAHFPSDVLGGWIMAILVLSFVLITSGLA